MQMGWATSSYNIRLSPSLGKVRPQNHSIIMQFAPIFKWTYSRHNEDIFLYLCLCLEYILNI
jgi:hypothetical protein